MYQFFVIFCLLLNLSFINCRDSNEFCSNDGKSLMRYIVGISHSIPLRKCPNYYNLKRKRCVSKEQYYLPGTCGNINSDPFEPKFVECRNFPHLIDCTKYYKCRSSRYEYVNCMEGTFVNPTTMECDAQECQKNHKGYEECNESNSGKRVYQVCGQYMECMPQHKLYQCPFGLSYNLNTSQCDLQISDNDYCYQKDLANIDCSVEGFYGLSFDPTLFYVCSFEEKSEDNYKPMVVLRQCPLGKVFNSTTQDCENK